MQESFELKAESRADAGKGASRRLRNAGKVPAIVYGGGKDPLMIALDHNDLLKHLEHEAFYSHVLTVDLDGLRETRDLGEKEDDVDSVDLLTGIITEFEKHAWFLRASLEK